MRAKRTLEKLAAPPCAPQIDLGQFVGHEQNLHAVGFDLHLHVADLLAVTAIEADSQP